MDVKARGHEMRNGAERMFGLARASDAHVKGGWVYRADLAEGGGSRYSCGVMWSCLEKNVLLRGWNG